MNFKSAKLAVHERFVSWGLSTSSCVGLTQSFTKVRATKTLSIVNANVTYTLDAAGNLTSDGLRDFEYDEANRLSKVKLFKDGGRTAHLGTTSPQAYSRPRPTPKPP
ncbi:MAG: hypothetical protein KAY82_04110 [Hylemonella sp.]|nr:hypothetical protein [Hylemonella sp.]